jgi:ribonuclease Z
LEAVRQTYDGPLTFATDLLVWNVTQNAITMREAVFPNWVRLPSTTKAYKKTPRSGEPPCPSTSWMAAGRILPHRRYQRSYRRQKIRVMRVVKLLYRKW